MEEFCEKVIEFLSAEYSDSYEFSINATLIWPNMYEAELLIRYSRYYKLKITAQMMNYLFSLYNEQIYIEERSCYKWQKELVDLIEGS